MVNSAKKCTPNDNPIKSEINNSHRLPLGKCISSPQRNPAHINNDINKDAMAYTSASVALNQKLSEKVRHRQPISELPSIIMVLPFVSSPNFTAMFFNSNETDQYIKSMANDAENTETIFTIRATFSLENAKSANTDPINWYSGAPGGWPTCNLAAVDMYSPESQKLTVGSTVRE